MKLVTDFSCSHSTKIPLCLNPIFHVQSTSANSSPTNLNHLAFFWQKQSGANQGISCKIRVPVEALWRWFLKLGCSENDRSDQSICPFWPVKSSTTLDWLDQTTLRVQVVFLLRTQKRSEKHTAMMSVASPVWGPTDTLSRHNDRGLLAEAAWLLVHPTIGSRKLLQRLQQCETPSNIYCICRSAYLRWHIQGKSFCLRTRSCAFLSPFCFRSIFPFGCIKPCHASTAHSFAASCAGLHFAWLPWYAWDLC